MARKVRDKALDTRAERTKLKARGNPYWRALDPGAHLGYRRIAGKAGAWTLRTYVKGRPENPYDVEVIGIADDMSDANGADVLNFYQAQERARARRDERSRSAAGVAGPLTVAKAMEHYLVFLEGQAQVGSRCRLPLRGIHQRAARRYRSSCPQGATDTQLAF